MNFEFENSAWRQITPPRWRLSIYGRRFQNPGLSGLGAVPNSHHICLNLLKWPNLTCELAAPCNTKVTNTCFLNKFRQITTRKRSEKKSQWCPSDLPRSLFQPPDVMRMRGGSLLNNVYYYLTAKVSICWKQWWPCRRGVIGG